MASNGSVSRMVYLANIISAAVTRIQEDLSAKGLPSPSFDENAVFKIPPEIATDHDAVLDATAELHDLLLGPLDLIHSHGSHNNSTCLQAIAEFEIADMVPPNGQVSFSDIARQTPLTEQMVARLLRHAITMRVFREPVPGMVAHTTASKTLHRSAANNWLQAGTKEMWPAATKMVEALKKWPKSQEPIETGYSLSNNGSDTIYAIFSKDAERAERWAKGMKAFSQSPEFGLAYVTDYYDWAALGTAQVVDIGGSQGHVSIALARRFAGLNLIVQDMEKVVENVTILAELRDRVRIMAQNLFDPQPIIGADVYFLRWIMHNWSDKYCLQILRALVPALNRGAKVIIQEMLMPEPGTVAMWKEKKLRASDLTMASAFNSQERTVAEFKTLFEAADSAFVLQSVIEPEGSALGMLVFGWEGPARPDAD